MDPSSLTYLAPAKMNLHLRVAPPDANGFHPLRSWMVTVGLCDVLTAAVIDAADRVSLQVDDHPTLTADSTNLVHRAATALRPPRSIALRLQKQIPIGAGLGGGSADAAATLVLVDELLSLHHSRDELHAIASTLGSDVPFFLHAPAAMATGRGERLEICSPPVRAKHALLILPPFGVSTPAAYRTLDAVRPIADENVLAPIDVDAWAKLPANELLPRLINDLESAAFKLQPRLASLRLDLERLLGRTVRMSGSGSTLFTLYDDAEEAAFAVAKCHLQPTDGTLRVAAVPIGIDKIRSILPSPATLDVSDGFSD